MVSSVAYAVFKLLTIPLTDEVSFLPRTFLLNVEATLKSLAEQEDTDGNMQITIEDRGPKVRFPCQSILREQDKI